MSGRHQPDPDSTALAGVPASLCHQNLSLWRDARVNRMLALAGHSLRLGLPRAGEGLAVWGRSPTAWRGEVLAARSNLPLVRIEDAFLRSLHPGRAGKDAPLGLLIDPVGVHFDSAGPSRLEDILQTADLQDSNILDRSAAAIDRLKYHHLSKYNIHDPNLPAPDPGFILVVDQTRGDAAIRYAGASAATFEAMLAAAKHDNPGARIVIRSHPETTANLRPGHFGPEHAGGLVTLLTAPVSPHHLLAAAAKVYTVSSQLGFEAILHGHIPRVFGQPFYASWGLTQDAQPLPRRTRRLTAEQLFAGAMILAPLWYDPCRDRLCALEDVIDQLEAGVKAFRQDRLGHVAAGMRLWKRPRLQAVFGTQRALTFCDDPDRADQLATRTGRGLLLWASKEPDGFTPLAPCLRIEDGFLRSRGLGADLVPPLSLVADDRGISYDPTRPSQLDALLSAPLPPGGKARAERLLAQLRDQGLSKYNLPGAPLPPLPPGHRILVPGQVEDDASILKGAGTVRTNLALLQATRTANPDAILIYKPHPDVVAGLRPGAIPDAALQGLADLVLPHADPAGLLAHVQEVWTITSLLGFEALIRGLPVTCLGMPFYAGRGLTRDHSPPPDWRGPTDLATLAHAALIAYPRYWDPVSRRPCPPEVALDRLAKGDIPTPSRANRLLAKLQGRCVGLAHLWR
jgi:capsular polysaccharide export protein